MRITDMPENDTMVSTNSLKSTTTKIRCAISLQFAIHLFNIYLIIFLIMSYPCGKCYRLFHQQEKHKFALSLISLVGISISVAALALAFLTFAFLR